MRVAGLLLGAALATGVVAAAAADDFPATDRARGALEQASRSLEAAWSGQAQLAALGKAVTAHEIALAAYRDGLRTMAGRESLLRAEMQRDRARLEQLAVALQSLGRAPRSALLAVPGGPVGAARGAALMAAVSPQLDARIAELRPRLEALARLRSAQEAARIEARGALAALQELRADTTEALRKRRRRDLPGRDELRARAEAAVRRAQSLDALTAALGSAATGVGDAGGDLVTFTEARGLVPSPVQGVLTAGSGERDPWGRQGPGVTVSAAAYAQVSAPWDATVRYAGPLIDYGQIVVLEPEEGTLIVLAGLATVDRLVGETVLSGERLGDLGGPLPDSDEFSIAAATDRDAIPSRSLYIELRRAGQPVDPALWFDLAMQGTDG